MADANLYMAGFDMLNSQTTISIPSFDTPSSTF